MSRKKLALFPLFFLEAATKRYDLKMPPVVGECLMLKAMGYSGLDSYSKLSDLCAYIGNPLPDYSHRTALDRAKGQIVLLRAMSKSIAIEGEEPDRFIIPVNYVIEDYKSENYIVSDLCIIYDSVIEEPEDYIIPDGYPIPEYYVTTDDYI